MGVYKDRVLNNEWVPWRLRNRLEKWTEGPLRRNCSWMYQLFHFGRIRDVMRPITQGPKHHFFGYYEKSPWNATGDLVLAHQSSFNDRPPTSHDLITIGLVNLKQKNEFISIGTTKTWNWQQGSMLQWHPLYPDRLIVHNDCRHGRHVGIVRNIEGKVEQIYEHPIYAVSSNGMFALSLNFSRLQNHRPGYGYAGVSDPWANEKKPENDGIFLIDLNTGKSQLIVSLAQLADNNPSKEMDEVYHWVNHIQISKDGRYFAFFHLWRVGKDGWGVRLYSAKTDGTELNCLLDTDIISHYDWMGNSKLLVWAKKQGVGLCFLLCDIFEMSQEVIGKNILSEDGHCSFSPDKKWILNDTYPDAYGMRTLMLYHMEKKKRLDLSRLYSPREKWWGEIRCDLHPRWSRDGKFVCIDSVHSGERQMYIGNVEGIVA